MYSSTLAALLLKLRTAEPGMLFVGGEDVTELSAVDLRDAIAYVPQDGFLFSASIRDNTWRAISPPGASPWVS